MSSTKRNVAADENNIDGVLEDVQIDAVANSAGDAVTQQQGAVRRFKGWTVLFVANLVCVIALALGRPKNTSAQKWTKWILALSFIFSFAPIVVHFSPLARAVFTSVVELGLVRQRTFSSA
jgi:hypothetical protein